MKRILALVLALFLLAGCGATAQSTTPPTTAETTLPEATDAPSNAGILDGKKIIFIGNSYTQAANAVIDYGFGTLTQRERSYDQGYFYQICKANGADTVNVTAWCFGGHNITDTFAEACTKADKPCTGENHPGYLEDPYYDYVVIQPYFEPKYQGDLLAHLQPTMDFFKEANPDVKFLVLVPHMAVEKEYAWAKDLSQLEGSGIIICNWGSMLHDIVKGNTEVPGAKQSYARPTFVISVSQEDGHHQNILAGYLTALMVYCAITGDTAVGQPYEFCYDNKVNSKFVDLETYKSKRYVYEPYTNFDLVFQSPEDMAGLQQLVDQYIAKFN